jgi:hypothetical protein
MTMTLSDDDILMNELRDAVAARTVVTDRAREAARAAFSWRTIDEELMNLVHDSATAGELLVRSAATARVFGFRGRDRSLEVELDGGTLTGQVVPGQVCRVTVVSRDTEPVVVQTDESGFFTLAFEASGTVRFVVDVDVDPLSTGWISF